MVKEKGNEMPDLWKAVQRIMNYSNDMVKVKRIMARVIRCWKLSKSKDSLSTSSQTSVSLSTYSQTPVPLSTSSQTSDSLSTSSQV